jgi:hypothetical protein
MKGFWNYWLIGGKIFLASLVSALVTGVFYALFMALGAMAKSPALLAIGMMLSFIIFILVGLFLTGYFANKFWGMK